MRFFAFPPRHNSTLIPLQTRTDKRHGNVDCY